MASTIKGTHAGAESSTSSCRFTFIGTSVTRQDFLFYTISTKHQDK